MRQEGGGPQRLGEAHIHGLQEAEPVQEMRRMHREKVSPLRQLSQPQEQTIVYKKSLFISGDSSLSLLSVIKKLMVEDCRNHELCIHTT